MHAMKTHTNLWLQLRKVKIDKVCSLQRDTDETDYASILNISSCLYKSIL